MSDVCCFVAGIRYGDSMHTPLVPRRIARGPKRRHEARVQRFSTDEQLLDEMDALAVDEVQARLVVEAVCMDLAVDVPRLRFHARRSPYTGATEQPRRHLVERYGEENVRRLEESRNYLVSEQGAIRLGRNTTLMTVAHELGHHLVFSLDPLGTPNHGRRWVQRFDQAAKSIQRML